MPPARVRPTQDRVRAARSDRFKLIKNFRPELAWVGRNVYTRGAFPSVEPLLELKANGELTPELARFMADRKPELEFYDLEKDPLELDNRIDDPEYGVEIAKLSARLGGWIEQTDANNPFPEELETIVPAKARKRVIEQRAAATED